MKRATLEISDDGLFKISWRVAGAVIASVIIAVFYIATVDSQAREAVEHANHLESTVHEISRDLTEINSRTIRMEAILNEWKKAR